MVLYSRFHASKIDHMSKCHTADVIALPQADFENVGRLIHFILFCVVCIRPHGKHLPDVSDMPERQRPRRVRLPILGSVVLLPLSHPHHPPGQREGQVRHLGRHVRRRSRLVDLRSVCQLPDRQYTKASLKQTELTVD